MAFPEKKGSLLQSYKNVSLYDGFPYKLYIVNRQEFSPEQQKFIEFMKNAIKRSYSSAELKGIMPIEDPDTFVEKFNSEILQTIEINQLYQQIPSPELFEEIAQALSQLLKEHIPQLENEERIANAILSPSIGYGKLAPLVDDEELEEIMVNVAGKPLFVFHKTEGMCQTNIFFESEGELKVLISRIANTVGKRFDENYPLLDARLPGGARVNATFKSVTPFGYSVTIRKFNKKPIPITQLINNRTISVEAAAFLWLAVEGLKINPANMLVSGGAGSGKTTMLNALCAFMRPEDRITTIEDTLELDLGERENWIQLESRPKIQDLKEVSMDDLLKNSFRMRPDRIIMGEVRGEEAQTMFVAMDTGHKGLLGTLHSNTSREMILRLKASPMNVPVSMIPLLDLAIIMFRMYTRKHGMIRRVKEITEIDHMNEKILLSNVFEWDKRKDYIAKSDVPARTIDKFSEATGLSKKEVMDELSVRRRVLQWMVEQRNFDWAKVQNTIHQYYFDPKSIIEKVFKR